MYIMIYHRSVSRIRILLDDLFNKFRSEKFWNF